MFGHQRGSFSSEGYPKPYEKKDRNCVWILNRGATDRLASHKRSLTLAFQDFSVGQRNSVTGECDEDFVEVREGKGFLAPFLTRLCGNTKPDPITTFSDSLYVKFHTEKKTSHSKKDSQRFKAYFKTDGNIFGFYIISFLTRDNLGLKNRYNKRLTKSKKEKNR